MLGNSLNPVGAIILLEKLQTVWDGQCWKLEGNSGKGKYNTECVCDIISFLQGPSTGSQLAQDLGQAQEKALKNVK